MNRKKSGRQEDDEVGQMLQAAQDELLLKLSVDSHMSRVSPDYLLPDLDTRFQALKSRPSKSSNPQLPPPRPHSAAPATTNCNDDDDLMTRFAALKAKGSSSSASTATITPAVDSDDEEDEVEKIIRWAKDAARLDPSPPSDSDDSGSDDDNDDREVVKKRK